MTLAFLLHVVEDDDHIGVASDHPVDAAFCCRRSQIAPDAAAGSAPTVGGTSQTRVSQSSGWYRGQPGSPVAANDTQAPRIAADRISNSRGTADPNRSLPSGPSGTPKLNGTSRPSQAPRARSRAQAN